MKSRNLLTSALMAVMVGGMVLAPSLASAQSRDRNSRRDNSSSRNRDRDSVKREDQNRRDRDRNVWNGSNSRDRDHDNDRDHDSNWWKHPTSRSDRDRDHDRDDRWRNDHDRDDWRNDHDRDDRRYRRPVIVNRYPTYNNYPNYGYGNNYDYGYRNSGSRDEWRSIAEAAGLIAVIGLLEHDDTLTFIGGAGALYSLSRYDSDRHSRDRERRLRAEYFDHPYFVRNGRRYDRQLVTIRGERYYQFVCR